MHLSQGTASRRSPGEKGIPEGERIAPHREAHGLPALGEEMGIALMLRAGPQRTQAGSGIPPRAPRQVPGWQPPGGPAAQHSQFQRGSFPSRAPACPPLRVLALLPLIRVHLQI